MPIKESPVSSAEVLQWQMASVPVVNREVKITQTDEGRTRLSVPLAHRGWSKALKHVLRMSEVKNVELDALGSEIFALFDGTHTVEELIDMHRERWMLSFFEARAMIFQFLRDLMKWKFVALVVPEPESPAEDEEEE